jgi:pyruvate dehydrogenase E1 component beta subunit
VLQDGEDNVGDQVARALRVVQSAAAIDSRLEVAAEQLAQEGIEAEVVDLRTLVPCDEQAVFASVAKTKRAVVVHEAVTRCGFGAELSSRIHEELFGELAAPVQRVGGANTPVPYASNLEADFIPQAHDIVAAVKRTIK